MAAEDALRLAWEADHDGRRKLRDSLLTFALLESGPGDHWAERCRARLIAERPGYYLGGFASIRLAMADPRVVEARDRLRAKYPAARVLGLLLRARAGRGTFTGRAESLDAMLEDLVGLPAGAENVRRDAAEVARGPLVRLRSPQPISSGLIGHKISTWDDGPPKPPEGEPGDEIARFSLRVLFAIAMLLEAVRRDREPGR